MDALIKFIEYKESTKINDKPNKPFSEDNNSIEKENSTLVKVNKDNLAFKNLTKDFNVLIDHEDAFEKLNKIMINKKYTSEYNYRIKIIFFNFLNI